MIQVVLRLYVSVYASSSGPRPGTIMAMLLPFKRVWPSLFVFRPSGVFSLRDIDEANQLWLAK